MARSVLIRGARQLLTLHGPSGPRRGEGMRQLSIIEDGAVLISDGLVSSVGPTRRIENLAEARSAEEINAVGRVVMPGLIDSHTRLIAAPPRLTDSRSPFLQDLPLSPATERLSAEHVRRTSGHSLEHQARKYLFGCLRHGTTTLETKSGYGLDESGEIKMLRVMARLPEMGINVISTFRAPHLAAPEFNGSSEEHVTWICDQLLPKVRSRSMVRFAEVLCDPTGFPLAHASLILNTARRLGLPTKVHAEYSARTGAVRMAVEMGSVSVDGLEHVDQSDAQLLGQSRTIAVVMPGSFQGQAGGRFAPARQLIDQGAALALASGFHPRVSSTFNMMTAISLACTQMRLSPEEAITAATINGAHALMCSSAAGSLEFGKEADLVMLAVSDYREIPYQFGVNLVSMTMRKGQVMYREGQVECPAG